jgi:hypothetical protein
VKAWLAKIAAGVGGALAILAPVGRCPVCLSTATGVVGSTSIGILASKPWFLPATGLFLLVGLWGTIASARAHCRWGAVWAMAIGAGLLVGGRLLTQGFLLWAGAGLLTAALLLDLYWKRKLPSARLVRIRGVQ